MPPHPTTESAPIPHCVKDATRVGVCRSPDMALLCFRKDLSEGREENCIAKIHRLLCSWQWSITPEHDGWQRTPGLQVRQGHNAQPVMSSSQPRVRFTAAKKVGGDMDLVVGYTYSEWAKCE
jgi:hypothetical protein